MPTENARQAFDNAFSLIAAGRIEDAERSCRDSLGRLPDDINLLGLLGAILLKRGRIDEAESVLLRAIALEPAFAKPHEDLGTLYLQRNKPAEAIASFETAVRLEGQPSALLGLATALHRGGQSKRSEKICGEVLSKDTKNVRALRLLAKIASDDGRHAAAEGLLRRIVELAPDFQPGYSDLAGFLAERSRFHEAAGLYEKAIGIDPEQATLHLKHADLLAIINRPQAALTAYERCLAHEPANLPALMGRGHMQRILGRRDAAILSYTECTRLQPAFGDAWWNLASMRGYRFTPAMKQRMQSLLADAQIDENSRIALSFALARACEAEQDFAAAWTCYMQGNSAKRRTVRYDPVETAAQNDARINAFTRNTVRRLAAGAEAATGPTPIFVVGVPRSGSTLIEQILASHSQVEGCGELPYVPMLAAMLGNRRDPGERYPEDLANLEPRELLQLGRDYLGHSAAHHQSSTGYFTDKMPVNFQHVGLIHLMLPKAVIIDARRNPLDACVGNFRQLFAQGKNQSYDLLELGEYYLEYRRLMDHWDAVLPGRVLTVHYEDVVRDLEGEVRRLLQHCSLPFEEACLEFHASQRSVNTASAEQVREPVYSDGVGYWKHYQPQLTELKRILEPVL